MTRQEIENVLEDIAILRNQPNQSYLVGGRWVSSEKVQIRALEAIRNLLESLDKHAEVADTAIRRTARLQLEIHELRGKNDELVRRGVSTSPDTREVEDLRHRLDNQARTIAGQHKVLTQLRDRLRNADQALIAFHSWLNQAPPRSLHMQHPPLSDREVLAAAEELDCLESAEVDLAEVAGWLKK